MIQRLRMMRNILVVLGYLDKHLLGKEVQHSSLPHIKLVDVEKSYDSKYELNFSN